MQDGLILQIRNSMNFEFIMIFSGKHTRRCIVEPLSTTSYVRAVPEVLQVCSKRCLMILFTCRPVHDRSRQACAACKYTNSGNRLFVGKCPGGEGCHQHIHTLGSDFFITSPRICLLFSLYIIHVYIHCMYIVQKRGYNNVLVPYTSMQRFMHKGIFF